MGVVFYLLLNSIRRPTDSKFFPKFICLFILSVFTKLELNTTFD